MKIAFALSLSLKKPGPSVHILTSLIAALADAGNAIHIVAQRPAGAVAPDLPPALDGRPGITIETIDAPDADKSNFIKRYVRQLRHARSVGKRLRALDSVDVVYVHSNNTLGLFAHAVKRYMKGAALVLNVQDIFPENAALIGALRQNGLIYRALAAVQRYAYRRADAIITLSPDMKNTLVKAGASEARVHVIELWSYGDELGCVPNEQNQFLAEHPVHRDAFRVLYAGNIGAMQNVALILSAAELLKGDRRIHFLIVGDGARKAAHEAYAQAHELSNVYFYPMLASERAVDLYSMADVNLITLAPGVIYTAFPSKTTTCCAVGRPIIACVDSGSQYAAMIAACDKCFVVDASDPAALSARIKENLADRITGTSAGARAIYHERLSAATGIARHIALFDALTNASGRETKP